MDVERIIKEQDDQIDDIALMVKRIHNNANLMNKELVVQEK
jgi:hypothetical protein